MPDQATMFGVEPKNEPVSERSLEEKPKAERKKPRTDRARGIVRHGQGDAELIVTMRPDKIIVRAPGRKHRSEKPLADVIGFVIGQGELFRDTAADELADALRTLIDAIVDDAGINPMTQIAYENAIEVLNRKYPCRAQ